MVAQIGKHQAQLPFDLEQLFEILCPGIVLISGCATQFASIQRALKASTAKSVLEPLESLELDSFIYIYME